MRNKPRQSIKLFECFAEVLPVISKRSLGRVRESVSNVK